MPGSPGGPGSDGKPGPPVSTFLTSHFTGPENKSMHGSD